MKGEGLYLTLNHIQHFTFCKRQWGLMFFDGAWEENYLTLLGQIVHEKVHNSKVKESRKTLFLERGMPVISEKYRIYGVLDAVEFEESEEGVEVYGRKGKTYWPRILEYKRGRPKKDLSDKLQLAAQVVCLEEMLHCTIEKGYLYYHSTHRRLEVPIDKELREELQRVLEEMRGYVQREELPAYRCGPHCKMCSLYEICMPELTPKKRINQYIKKYTGVAYEKDTKHPLRDKT